MEIQIRAEKLSDDSFVSEVIRTAFANAERTNGREFQIVESLRKSNDFIPELSLVAVANKKIVGHILFSQARVVSQDAEYGSLVLGPVAVLPQFQKCGVGAQLIEHGHRKAKELGFTSVILLGHPSYYPRFGYKKASHWGIRSEWNVPDEAFMALELKEGSLKAGVVKYPPEFLA